jgi:SpoVK/Ycf46/Vps4 family AAA+-type ATPase
MGEQELTAYGFAAARKNPKGQLIIEMATVSPTKSQAKMRACAVLDAGRCRFKDRVTPRFSLARRTAGLTGADLEGICRQAAMLAIREFLEEQGSKGAEAQGSGGAEEHGSKGAREQRSRGAKEQGSGGAEVPSRAPLHPGPSAPPLKIGRRHFARALANRCHPELVEGQRQE